MIIVAALLSLVVIVLLWRVSKAQRNIKSLANAYNDLIKTIRSQNGRISDVELTAQEAQQTASSAYATATAKPVATKPRARAKRATAKKTRS